MEMLRCDNCGHIEPRGSTGARRIRFRVDAIAFDEDRGHWHACSWSCLEQLAARHQEPQARSLALDSGQRDLSGIS